MVYVNTWLLNLHIFWDNFWLILFWSVGNKIETYIRYSIKCMPWSVNDSGKDKFGVTGIILQFHYILVQCPVYSVQCPLGLFNRIVSMEHDCCHHMKPSDIVFDVSFLVLHNFHEFRTWWTACMLNFDERAISLTSVETWDSFFIFNRYF